MIPRFQAFSPSIPRRSELRTLIHKPINTPEGDEKTVCGQAEAAEFDESWKHYELDADRTEFGVTSVTAAEQTLEKRSGD